MLGAVGALSLAGGASAATTGPVTDAQSLDTAQRAQVTISEEELTEYLCDYPNCPNFATRIVGRLVELRLMAAVCETHLSMLRPE